ncbi:hypothetical protein [Streptomyces sp. SID161]|uniref:hypothetical protein n=1 Tax=Streptomyces sp. SID161 TaxID=2690251 RepID=UPI001F314A5A|nr:hypothetical protein [Streptomyces sp. SID161]
MDAVALQEELPDEGGSLRGAQYCCYSGADARPPELPLAQSVANELGVPVTAPTSKVGTSPQLGLNQTPTIGNNGYWRTYLPMAH